MDRQRMHRLGKRLIAFARHVNGEPQHALADSAEVLVVGDVAAHPRSSNRQVVERSDFTQGHGATGVAQMDDRSLATVQVDTSDSRCTLVSASACLVTAVRLRTLSIEELIGSAVPDPRAAVRLIALIDVPAEVRSV